jgi:hypothetical protein
MKISTALLTGALALGTMGSAEAATFFGPASGGIAILGAPAVTLSGVSGSESYNDPAFIFSTTGSLTSATGVGSALGTLDFSQTVGTTITEAVPGFLKFVDSSGGDFVFNIASVQTLSFTSGPSSTTIGLYLLGSAGDSTLGLLSAPTSVTITANQTGASAYSASASIASPPSLSGGVPEPATWAMMLVGLGGIGATMRLRRKAVAVRA